MKKNNEWHYSDHMIRLLWRNALDKREQIRILAELNCRTVEEVKQKLNELGLKMEPEPLEEWRGKQKIKKERWTPEKVDQIRRMRKMGCSVSYICTVLHTSHGTLRRVMEANGMLYPYGSGRTKKNKEVTDV